MKKVFLIVILFILLAGSFVGGILYSQGGAGKNSIAREKTSDGQSSQADLDSANPSSNPGAVKITPQRQQTIGIRVGTVERTSETQAMRTLGRIAPDENRLHRLIAASEGFIWDVHGITTGSLVQKDQLLATFYVNEFFGRQQQYFFGLDYQERARESSGAQPPGGQPPSAPPPGEPTSSTKTPTPPPYQFIKTDYRLTRDQVELARQELINLGVGEYQIREIERTRQYAKYVEIRSPAKGLVLARNVWPRQKFAQGTEFFTVADLSRVWIVADVFGQEARTIQPGMGAGITLPDQAQAFKARVSDILPQVDTASRTFKVRLETDNPGYVLRPGLFVEVEFSIAFPQALTIPADAILDSGLKKTVFVDRGNGFFEPREVETGWRAGNRVEVVKGLEEGERIVTSGTFLIDSESRLELAAAGMIGALSKDPVCGQDVSVNKAEKSGRKSASRGKTYYFCSGDCKTQFDKNPDQYVKQ
jgi:YHS domain-containing protein